MILKVDDGNHRRKGNIIICDIRIGSNNLLIVFPLMKKRGGLDDHDEVWVELRRVCVCLSGREDDVVDDETTDDDESVII